MAKENVCGIYVIKNSINNKCYVGQSIDIYRRWYEHQNPKVWDSYKSKVLYRAFIKYGIENFTFEIVEECKFEELDAREKHWICVYDSYNNGYNMTKGGQNNRSRDYTHRSKKKRIEWFDEFLDYLVTAHPSIYSTFEEMRFGICPYANTLEDIDDDDILEEIDGYDTLIRDFSGGYENFERWAECNLI